METAFEVSTEDQSLAVPMTLPEIFNSATAKVGPEDLLLGENRPLETATLS